MYVWPLNNGTRLCNDTLNGSKEGALVVLTQHDMLQMRRLAYALQAMTSADKSLVAAALSRAQYQMKLNVIEKRMLGYLPDAQIIPPVDLYLLTTFAVRGSEQQSADGSLRVVTNTIGMGPSLAAKKALSSLATMTGVDLADLIQLANERRRDYNLEPIV